MKLWAIRVGKPNTGYLMDNLVFDTKAQAISYKKQQGVWTWSKEWHVIKLKETK